MNEEYINRAFIEKNGINWIFDILNQNTSSFVYKQIDLELIEYNTIKTTLPIWSSGSQLLSVATQSINTDDYSKNYSLFVYSSNTCENDNEEFIIEYGSDSGDSIDFEYKTEKTHTQGVYKKYKKILEDIDTINYTNFIAIQFNKNKNQYGLYSDVFSITFANPLTSSIYSTLVTDVSDEYFSTGSTVFDLVSGSLEYGVYLNNNEKIKFGKLYKEYSLLLLNADLLNQYINIGIETGSSSNQYNPVKMYNSISSSIHNVNTGVYPYWSFVNAEIVKTVLTFPVRIELDEYNYTTNKTYSDSSGKLLYNQNVSTPSSYFTTIGFYNDKYELLAVAKLSKPILKNYTEKYTFQVSIEII